MDPGEARLTPSSGISIVKEQLHSCSHVVGPPDLCSCCILARRACSWRSSPCRRSVAPRAASASSCETRLSRSDTDCTLCTWRSSCSFTLHITRAQLLGVSKLQQWCSCFYKVSSHPSPIRTGAAPQQHVTAGTDWLGSQHGLWGQSLSCCSTGHAALLLSTDWALAAASPHGHPCPAFGAGCAAPPHLLAASSWWT